MTRVPERRGFNPLSLLATLSPITARVADGNSSVCALLDGYLGQHGFRALSGPTATSPSARATAQKNLKKLPPSCV
jgi:hypothetical protein